uniref:C-type lectin domain-containing protein n=1 Tax=Seriola lalandi dorsalis TaxID=1841481 RepID=A0A3B4XMV1_SERLL
MLLTVGSKSLWCIIYFIIYYLLPLLLCYISLGNILLHYMYLTVIIFYRSSETHVLINKFMTWTEAQSYCRANHTDLTSVRNLQENQKVMNLVPSNKLVWIGLFRDSWKWLDGSNSSFRNWHENVPDNRYHKEECVAANFANSGKWEDWTCDYRRAFICYSGKP